MKVSFLTSNNNNSNNGVTKQYVDDQDALRVAKTGDIMTGPLTLSGDAVNPLHAVSLQQLNEAVNNIGGGVNEFIASGDIPSAGLTVGINNDGTVSVISGSGQPESLSDPIVFNSGSTYEASAAYDSINNKVVIAYQDGGNSGYGKVIVGTVSGNSISFGAPVVFNNNSTYRASAVYDPINQKVVIAYNSSGYGSAIVGTVSGDSISFGSPVVFNNGSTDYISPVYDPINQKVVIAYQDYSNAHYGTAIVGTVSGDTISFGNEIVFSNGNISHISAVYDSTNNKVVIAYQDGSISLYGFAIVGTVSGNSISFGSPVVFNSTDTYEISAVYDPINNKVVIVYQDGDGLYYGAAIVGTVSENSISFGNEVVFSNSITWYMSAVYNPINNKVVITYINSANSWYGTAIMGTVIGDSISFASEVVFSNGSIYDISAAYDSTNQKVVIAYTDYSNSDYGTAIAYSPSTLTTNKDTFIGISQHPANDGDTVKVKIFAQVDSNQSGLMPGQLYYVANDGTLTTDSTDNILAGRALSPTKLLIKK